MHKKLEHYTKILLHHNADFDDAIYRRCITFWTEYNFEQITKLIYQRFAGLLTSNLVVFYPSISLRLYASYKRCSPIETRLTIIYFLYLHMYIFKISGMRYTQLSLQNISFILECGHPLVWRLERRPDPLLNELLNGLFGALVDELQIVLWTLFKIDPPWRVVCNCVPLLVSVLVQLTVWIVISNLSLKDQLSSVVILDNLQNLVPCDHYASLKFKTCLLVLSSTPGTCDLSLHTFTTNLHLPVFLLDLYQLPPKNWLRPIFTYLFIFYFKK